VLLGSWARRLVGSMCVGKRGERGEKGATVGGCTWGRDIDSRTNKGDDFSPGFSRNDYPF
jgi:hypothetical protein